MNVDERQQQEQPKTNGVLRRSVLKQATEEELRFLASERGVRYLADKDKLVESLLRSSYPVQDLPKVRSSSKRGQIIRAFVDENGKPYPTGTTLAGIRQRLQSEHGLSRQSAEKLIWLYRRDLTRYYGYDEVPTENETVKLSDARRKKALAARKNGSERES